jgi:CRP-like cAMP-binding protein
MKRYSENALVRAARFNHLLNALNERDLHAALAGASVTSLEHGRRLYREGGPVGSVYFPTNGVVSILAGTADSGDVEVATVGNEGVAGIDVMLGVPRALGRTITQVAGQGIAMGAKRFLELLRRRPQFSLLIHRYVYAFVRQMMQAGACNRLHTAEERCARWLLMTHDRAGRDDFGLTQDFLAQMMGTRRARVNLALAEFRRAGAIQYVYRRIQVVDRKILESFSCRCYDLIRSAYDLVTV